jgi:hypothetical protein
MNKEPLKEPAKKEIKTLAQFRSQRQSAIKKQKNIEKHLRIAKATKGHEQQVHINKVIKLSQRYSK